MQHDDAPVPPDPASELFETWQGAIWQSWFAAGHASRGCDGWTFNSTSSDGRVVCTACHEVVPFLITREAA
jgi:hypothetical protein